MATVQAVHRSAAHRFSKEPADSIELVAGLGVEGDAHQGATVQHRSRVAIDPSQPNLRQVHLIALEVLDDLEAKGFTVQPGDLGENVTTEGLDLLALPTGTVVGLGERALVALTGLRNPCRQIEAFESGLLDEVLERDDEGHVIRKAGVMGVVILGGPVRQGDPIEIALPPGDPVPLDRV